MSLKIFDRNVFLCQMCFEHLLQHIRARARPENYHFELVDGPLVESQIVSDKFGKFSVRLIHTYAVEGFRNVADDSDRIDTKS